MEEIKLGENIMKYRLKAQMTQDQLAEYIGVSKSAVSKWENAMTYPDITILPALATLFNVTVDTLMGYDKQLTKDAIIRIYGELSEEIAKGKIDEVLKKCKEYTKEYYSCFPFLLQLAVFYANHFDLCRDKMNVLEEAIKLCRRIQKESQEPALSKEAFYMEAIILMMNNQPEETLKLLGEEVKPLKQEGEMISSAFQQLGNMEKAKEITQICYYQYLLLLLGNGCVYMMMNIENLELVEETIKRLGGVMELFEVNQLHLNAGAQFYASAAAAYSTHGMKDQALEMLEKYLKVCQNADYTLHGDAYFDNIQGWLEGLALGIMPPRNEAIIKQSMLSIIHENPAFEALRDEAGYKAIVRRLKDV